MAVFFDYFSAASDEQAATVIDRPGGPGRAHAALAPQDSSRRGFFRRKSSGWSGPATETGTQFFTVFGEGIDPVVQMGTFEALLTGRAYDDIVDELSGGGYHEIILETPPSHVSHWLHVDLSQRIAHLGLPLTTIAATH